MNMVIVNCATLYSEVERGGNYMCPADNPSYSHRRSDVLGCYGDKRVFTVADIEATVDVYSALETRIRWINKPGDDREYAKRAVDFALRFRPDRLPLKVFLLGPLYGTNSMKDSRGGMQGSRRYLSLNAEVQTAQQAAALLNNRNWSEFGL